MKKLFNPFEFLSDRQSLLLGLAITALGSVLGMLLNARFDGLLDLHFSENVGYNPLVDNAIAITSSVVVLFILGKLINKKVRLYDILTASMISRFPIYLMTLFNLNNFMNAVTERLLRSTSPQDIDAIPAGDLIAMLIFSMMGFVFLVWFFVLLWNGFKVATNARGTRHVAFFILAIIIGEAISKIFFFYFEITKSW